MRLETELMRGVGPTAVLKLLDRSEMYGYELVEALSKHAEGVFAMGQSTLYPLLYNLEAKGLIDAVWRESPEGRDRKYYRLTRKGRTRLAADTEQFNALTQAMATIGILSSGASRLVGA